MPFKYNIVSCRGNYYRLTPYLYASGSALSPSLGGISANMFEI